MRIVTFVAILAMWPVFLVHSAGSAEVGDERDTAFLSGLASYRSGDYKGALDLWRNVAEQGNPEAQYFLGLMYDLGHGVPEDDVIAFRWYHKSALQGDPDAQWSVGVAYGNGDGVGQDLVQAVRWYRAAAEQGHDDAQVDLGVAYEIGAGVPRDFAQAMRWYSAAAAQGHPRALAGIGVMYGKGLGVSQDLVLAYMWSSLAATKGQEGANKNRDLAASLMTPSQIKKAQDLAREWLAAHPN
jgi:TPR repeat protein